jgi:ethanolamine ammonia-lyase small subunit
MILLVDGLSARAVATHAVPLLQLIVPPLRKDAWRIATAVVEQGRVAIGDEIGAGAEMVAVLIGERPGLSSPDSLGVYLTWAPRIGRKDAERNCISNIRPEGLGYAHAAAKLMYLLTEARLRKMTGVMLKDETSVMPRLGP